LAVRRTSFIKDVALIVATIAALSLIENVFGRGVGMVVEVVALLVCIALLYRAGEAA
jgi:hypothetical protein